MTSRTGTYPDTVEAYWYININFSSDRSVPGTLRLYNSNSELYLETSCLGKSASGLSQDQVCGDTPTGTYTGFLGDVQSDTNKYGPYKVIQMTGIAGKIATYSYRSGIWIHGGRDQTALQSTNGCVRVFNSAQLNLQNAITYFINSTGHQSTGYIYISE